MNTIYCFGIRNLVMKKENKFAAANNVRKIHSIWHGTLVDNATSVSELWNCRFYYISHLWNIHILNLAHILNFKQQRVVTGGTLGEEMNNSPLKGSEEAVLSTVLSIGIVLSCPKIISWQQDLWSWEDLNLGQVGAPASHMVCAEPGEKHDFHQGVFP